MATAASSSSTLALDKERERYVYTAKLAEQAERYDEMVEAMKKVAGLKVDLTVEERNLLSVGYKNVVGSRRASWRILSSIEHKEESRGNAAHARAIAEYRGRVEGELQHICSDIMEVIDSHLIPSSSSPDSSVFYLKMKGDYYRYLAEFKTGADKKDAADKSMEAYQDKLTGKTIGGGHEGGGYHLVQSLIAAMYQTEWHSVLVQLCRGTGNWDIFHWTDSEGSYHTFL